MYCTDMEENEFVFKNKLNVRRGIEARCLLTDTQDFQVL